MSSAIYFAVHGAASEVDLLLLGDVLHLRDRLAAVRAQLEADGPAVSGSRGQWRPHRCIAVERDVNRDATGFERLGLAKRSAGVSVMPDGRLRSADWRRAG